MSKPHLDPSRETMQAFAASEDEGPVVMVNLLEFAGKEGQQAYAQYAQATQPLIEKQGGRILYVGQMQEALVGEGDWDGVALVMYPSRKAFLAMVSSDEYRKGTHLRAQGLERTELHATRPIQGL